MTTPATDTPSPAAPEQTEAETQTAPAGQPAPEPIRDPEAYARAQAERAERHKRQADAALSEKTALEQRLAALEERTKAAEETLAQQQELARRAAAEAALLEAGLPAGTKALESAVVSLVYSVEVEGNVGKGAYAAAAKAHADDLAAIMAARPPQVQTRRMLLPQQGAAPATNPAPDAGPPKRPLDDPKAFIRAAVEAERKAKTGV